MECKLHTLFLPATCRYVHDVPGIERIRFATSHPRYFTDRLVRACSEMPKLCEFFHIPFQSGDDAILREMKRGYTAARYKSIIDNIRRWVQAMVHVYIWEPSACCRHHARSHCCQSMHRHAHRQNLAVAPFPAPSSGWQFDPFKACSHLSTPCASMHLVTPDAGCHRQ